MKRRLPPFDFRWPQDLIWVALMVVIIVVVVGIAVSIRPHPVLQNGVPIFPMPTSPK